MSIAGLFQLPELTGSKIHQAMKCPPSSVLPRDTNELREERHEPARNKGKVIHSFLEQVGKLGVDKALARIPDEETRLLCSVLDTDHMPVNCATEVAYAYNWRDRSARELGRNLGHRDYWTLPEPPTEFEIPCTLDVVGIADVVVGGRAIKRGFVSDYKSGRTVYPRPGQFGQTMLGALCVRAVLGVEDVTVELIHIHSDGDHHRVRDTVNEWALDAYAVQLEEMMESRPQMVANHINGMGLAFNEGRWCDHCAAYKHCDAKVALVRSVPGELVRIGVRTGVDGELTVEPGAINARSAGAVFEAIEKIEDVLARMKVEVCEIGYHTPVELSDGRVIEPRETSRRSVDGKIAAQVIQELYGREEAMKTISIEVSMADIRTAVQRNTDFSAKPKPKLETARGDGVLDKVIYKIAERGGVTTTTTMACKPYKPRSVKKLPQG